MKKILLKIIILSILMILAISLKSFAQSSFRFYCREGLKLNPGEIVEVPIYIDNIKIDGIEKKIFSFTGTIDFNNEVFELVPFDEDDNSSVFKVNRELEDYGIKVKYNTETKVISTTLDVQNNQNYFNGMMNSQLNEDDSYLDKYLNKAIQVGTIKIKAKENAVSGNYLCTISNVKGDNSETEFSVLSSETYIYIKPKNTGVVDDSQDVENKKTQKRVDITEEEASKKAILKIEISSDGKKVTITPDEKNGAVIKAITYKNKELLKEDGNFLLETEPNMVYELFIYNESGSCIGNEFVTAVSKEESEGKNSQGTDGKEDAKNTDKNIPDNVKKSPQTGDYIIIAVGVLLTILAGTLLTITVVKKQKIV